MASCYLPEDINYNAHVSCLFIWPPLLTALPHSPGRCAYLRLARAAPRAGGAQPVIFLGIDVRGALLAARALNDASRAQVRHVQILLGIIQRQVVGRQQRSWWSEGELESSDRPSADSSDPGGRRGN